MLLEHKDNTRIMYEIPCGKQVETHFEFAAELHNCRLIRQEQCSEISAESADVVQPGCELQENEEERRSVTGRSE